MAGLKILKSKQAGNASIIPLSDIWYQLDDCNDLQFSVGLANSLSKKGLIWPVLITNDKFYKKVLHKVERRPVPETVSTPYRCLIGGNRLEFARILNYTHISALFIKTLSEYKEYMKQTFMEPSEL